MNRFPFAPGVITRAVPRNNWTRRAARWVLSVIAVTGVVCLWLASHR